MKSLVSKDNDEHQLQPLQKAIYLHIPPVSSNVALLYWLLFGFLSGRKQTVKIKVMGI